MREGNWRELRERTRGLLRDRPALHTQAAPATFWRGSFSRCFESVKDKGAGSHLEVWCKTWPDPLNLVDEIGFEPTNSSLRTSKNLS